ncbi:CWF19-like protein 2 homolog [Sergentomyia squamirostris]
MSFIDFESAAEKEKIRQELRSVREKLLEKAEFNAKRRDEIAAHRKVNQWMLPSVSEKIESSGGGGSKNKQKKAKKKQKEKKLKKKKKSKKRHSSSDEDSSDSVEFIPKNNRKRRSSSSDSGSSTEDEWVEKKPSESDSGKPPVRDDWMSSGFLLPTYTKEQKNPTSKAEKSNYQEYDPSKCARELNPHWKGGGSGLPSTFMKPSDDIESKANYSSTTRRQNWKKIAETKTSRQKTPPPASDSSSSDSEVKDNSSQKPPATSSKAETNDFLTDAQMNDLGAKMIKAEIMGNTRLAEELKVKLEKAKSCRETFKDQVKSQRSQPKREEDKKEAEEVVLTSTDSRGITRPVSFREDPDLWGGRRGSKKKRSKVETHTASGERARFFPDDDRRTLQEMFQAEKMVSASDSDAQFARVAGKKRRQGDDLEDIFAEEVRKDLGEDEKSSKDRDRAIREHEQMTKTLDSCEMCFDSPKMAKELIVAMGSKVYLSLPWHEALQTGHCIISPIQHITCSTQLDEEVWQEVKDFQKALIRMFSAQKKDCVFYEIANKLHRRPHLTIHCIPSSGFELAPFYFKKAIQESETEWSTNRQLIDLKKEAKSVRRAIPRGLPYFWVSFSDHAGFAHVIEDQERFPSNFALEILGGLLNLDARRWRKPRREHNIVQKVKQFADSWKKYDITN